MTYPTAPLGVRIRIAPYAVDRTADPSTYTWTDITSRVFHMDDIVDEIGANDDASESNTNLSFTTKNEDGYFTSDNAESPLYPFFDVGCPIEYALDSGDGFKVQVYVFLGKNENDWTSNTQYRCLAKIEAGGVFRRLGLDPPIDSPVKRTLLSDRRKAIWMLEDESGSTAAASALPFQGPMTSLNPFGTPPDFGQSALVPGVSSMVKFSAGNNLSAFFATPTAGTSTRLSFLLKVDTPPAGQVALAALYGAPGTSVNRHVLELGPGNMRYRAYNDGGAELSGSSAVGFTAQQNYCVWVDWTITDFTLNVIYWDIRVTTWKYAADGTVFGTTDVGSGFYANNYGALAAVAFSPLLEIDDVYLGAISVVEGNVGVIGGTKAVLAWAGNRATERVAGMCGEFKQPFSVTNPLIGSAMGGQLVGSLLDNLRNIAEADHGVLTDHLGVVNYRALSELYNLTPALTLSRARRGQLGQLEPVRDDATKTNITGATRTGGSTVTTMDDEDVIRSGPYERSPIAVNVLQDSVLPGHAGWALARGAARGYRYDKLSLNLRVAAAEARYTNALDTWTRTIAGSWGLADSGQGWVTSADHSATGSAGVQSNTSVNVLRTAMLDVGSTDFDYYVSVSVPVTNAATATITQWVCGRLVDLSNYYAARLELGTTGIVQLSLIKRVAGVLSALATPLTPATATAGTGHASGDVWRVRFQGVGSLFRAYAWVPATTAEPTAWQVQAVDEAMLAGNAIALLSRLETGNTNTLPVNITWDNLAPGPTLPAQAMALKLGDRIAVTSLPPQAGKDGIVRQVRGRKQTVNNRGRKSWLIDYSLVPTEPYDAYALDSSRLDASGAELVIGATDTATILMASMPETTATPASGLATPLVIEGERVTLTTVANEAYADAFTRSVSNGWGSMPATAHLPAQAWAMTGTLSDYAVTGTAATATINAAPQSKSGHLTALLMRNLDAKVFMSFPVLATGANLELQMGYRWQLPANTGYTARICLEAATTVRLQLFEPGASNAIADILTPLTHTAGVTYGLRVLAVGTRHRIKVWQGNAAAEPTHAWAWNLDISSDARVSAGYPAIRAGRASGNTNAAATATFDNFEVNGVQAFTVQRSINGVVKTQPANGSIHVYNARGLGVGG